MKKTINETREMMNKINEFLSEDFNTPKKAAEDFVSLYAEELESILGVRWQTQGGEWANNYRKLDIIHDMIWEFVTKNYPEHMGDEEKSERFVQSVMQEL